jgi:TolA-binding protein
MHFLRICLVLTSLLSVGCVTHWRGKAIETDVAAIQGQVEQLTEDQRTLRERFNKTSTDLDARLGKLDASLREAIEKLRTNSADSGLVMDDLQREIALLRGELATFQHKASQGDVQGPPVIDKPVGGPQLPSEKGKLYKYGYERKQANECDEAVRAFMTLYQKFPKYPYTDNGLFLAADCQLTTKDHGASLRTLKIITQKYKKGDKMDDALILMADNFQALGQCERAILFLETVVNDYATSNRRKEAKRKLRKTKRKCKK